ncbi:MAG: hypothetical protein R2723_08115 [Microbacterium sp.]
MPPLLSAGMVVVAVVIGLLQPQGCRNRRRAAVVAGANSVQSAAWHELLSRPGQRRHRLVVQLISPAYDSFVSAVFGRCSSCARRAYVRWWPPPGAVAIFAVGALLVASGWYCRATSSGSARRRIWRLRRRRRARLAYILRCGAAPGSDSGAPSACSSWPRSSRQPLALAYLTTDASTDGATAATAGFRAIAGRTASTAALATRLFRRVA